MKERIIPVERPLSLMLFCNTCDRSLYETSKDNNITRFIADNVAEGHIEAYSKFHEVVLIEFTREEIM